jgi:hypothetical protein
LHEANVEEELQGIFIKNLNFLKNMLKNQQATTRSRNESSKKIQNDSVIESESVEDNVAIRLMGKYKDNNYMFYLMSIHGCLIYRLTHKFNELDHPKDCLNSLNILLKSKYKFDINSKDGLMMECKPRSDYEGFKEFLFMSFLGILVPYRVNLDTLERFNYELKGLNEFLSIEVPDIYEAYCKVSNQFGFNTIIVLDDNHLSMKWMEILQSSANSGYKAKPELLELDENFAVEKVPEDFNMSNFTKGYKIINCRNQYEDEAKHDFFGSTLLLASGLGYKVKDENNESHQIDDILRSFNNLLGSIYKFSLATDGNICLKIESNGNLDESAEQGVLILLGIFACLRINLEFLESQNLQLKGLNVSLSGDYPKIYYGYCALSQQYGFDRTVNLGLNPPDSPKEMLPYLQNMKVEKWNGDITKPDNHLPELKDGYSLPELKDGYSFAMDRLLFSEVVNTPTKKDVVKKPLRKRESIQTKSHRKAKKLFKVNQKQFGR